MKTILFSGIKPTGTPHLGNYLGTLKKWPELQDEYKCFYSIVDQHAITIEITPSELKKNTINLIKILLALGVDPNKSVLFLQSQVPAHTELAWILNCLLPVAEMERMTQYKDKAATHKKNINMGLFDYPALMAADILLYNAQVVPVGEDQLQHIELARLAARKFNQRYKKHFLEPQAKLSKALRVMSIQNPENKMSKELGEKNYISLLDDAKTVENKIMKAVTDSNPNPKKMSAGVQNLFNLLEWLGTEEEKNILIKQFENSTLKYSDLKKAVTASINQTLIPIQTKINQISDQEAWEIINAGNMRANKIAMENISKIKEIMGFLS